MTHIYIIAGEASGDFLGAQLMAALKSRVPAITFSGVGGPLMAEQGMDSLFPYHDLAVMGIAEIAPKLPLLLRRINQTAAHIQTTKPNIVITIDSPDFCLRVIKKVKKAGGDHIPKFIHYVAPSVWAWREGRAAKLANLVDGLICLFDFEPPYFEKVGLKSIAAGHPMIEGAAMMTDGDSFRRAQGIKPQQKVVGALFGSRRGEIKKTAPVIRDALFALAKKAHPQMPVIVPTLPHLIDDVTALMQGYPGKVVVTTDPAQKCNAFAAMDVAAAVSGTVGLELAVLGVPHIIAYKANPITAMMIRALVKVRYAHLANIMTDAAMIPEFLQDNCIPAPMTAALEDLLRAPEAQKVAMAKIAVRIGYGQPEKPSDKAAEFVLGF